MNNAQEYVIPGNNKKRMTTSALQDHFVTHFGDEENYKNNNNYSGNNNDDNNNNNNNNNNSHNIKITKFQSDDILNQYVVDHIDYTNNQFEYEDDDNVTTNEFKTTESDNEGTKLHFLKVPRRKKVILIMCTIAIFLSCCAFSLLGPFYPLEAEKKGMSPTVIGLVFGSFELVIFVSSPIFGNYLSRLGAKRVYIVGMFIGGVCNIIFGTLYLVPSGTPFITASISCRCAEAFGFSGFITASYAILSSEFPNNIGIVLGILETASGLGYMIGPAVGGALHTLGGYGLPFYVIGVAVILNGCMVYFFLPQVENIKAKRERSMCSLLRCPVIILPMCSVFVGVVGITTFTSTLAKHLKPFNLSTLIVSVFFGIAALVYSIMASLWGYLSDRKDVQAPLIIIGHLVLGTGFLAMGPSVLLPWIPFHLWTVCSGLALVGMAYGCALIPTIKCMTKGALGLGFPSNLDTYALVSALFNSVHCLGGFVGPVAVGALVERFDYPVAYTVVGGLSIFMACVWVVFIWSSILFRRDKRIISENKP